MPLPTITFSHYNTTDTLAAALRAIGAADLDVVLTITSLDERSVPHVVGGRVTGSGTYNGHDVVTLIDTDGVTRLLRLAAIQAVTIV